MTVVAGIAFGFLWFKIIDMRDAAIAHHLGAATFAPQGLVLLAVTVLAGGVLLRMWRTVHHSRVDPLHVDPLPDSPEATRHGAFDGTATPPTRW